MLHTSIAVPLWYATGDRMADTKIQNYKNHAHLPRLTQVAGIPALIAMVLVIVALVREPDLQGYALLCLTFSVLVLALISRAYTVRLQDRIIRLEMQLRLERLGLGSQFHRISTQQLVALRFASDAELPSLIDRAIRESLSGDQIKRAVTDWQPDLHRT